MSSLKEMEWGKVPSPVADAGRRLAAALLQRVSALLARLALGLTSEPAAARQEPRFEFHAEAGAFRRAGLSVTIGPGLASCIPEPRT